MICWDMCFQSLDRDLGALGHMVSVSVALRKPETKELIPNQPSRLRTPGGSVCGLASPRPPQHCVPSVFEAARTVRAYEARRGFNLCSPNEHRGRASSEGHVHIPGPAFLTRLDSFPTHSQLFSR